MIATQKNIWNKIRSKKILLLYWQEKNLGMIVRRRSLVTTKELKMDFLVALLWILKGIFIHNNRTCIFTLGGAFQKEPAAAVLLISKRILWYKSRMIVVLTCFAKKKNSVR